MESNIGCALLDWILFEARNRVLDTARGSPEMLQRPASDDLAAMAAFDDAIRKPFLMRSQRYTTLTI